MRDRARLFEKYTGREVVIETPATRSEPFAYGRRLDDDAVRPYLYTDLVTSGGRGPGVAFYRRHDAPVSAAVSYRRRKRGEGR